MFLSERLDVAVVEVGLGGRLDATNVVAPVVCGISSLGLDHTNVPPPPLYSSPYHSPYCTPPSYSSTPTCRLPSPLP